MAYSGPSLSPSRESERGKAVCWLWAPSGSSGRLGHPHPLEPVRRAGKSSAVAQTPEEALDLLLLLQWPLLGTWGGGG